MIKTIMVNGREYYPYQLSNKAILELAENEKYINEEQRNALNEIIFNCFKENLCPKCGETEDDVFVRYFSDFVNGKCISRAKVAKGMANDHRYLQQEMFKIFIEYTKVLSENYHKGFYDPRNEYACKCASKIVKCLEEEKLI